MQDKLHNAAAQGNRSLIEQYSKEPEFNVNRLHSKYGTRAIDCAAQAGKLDVLKYLIETLKADIADLPNKKSLLGWGIQSKNLELCRYIGSKKQNKASELFEIFILSKELEDLDKVEQAIRNKEGLDDRLSNGGQTLMQTAFIIGHADWKSHPNLQTKFFILLLQNGADIHANNFIYFNEGNCGVSTTRNVLAETIIRADLKAYSILFPRLNKQVTIQEIMNQLGERKLKNLQLHKVKSMLQTLQQDYHFDSALAKKILDTLEAARDLSIDPDDYPKCLMSFIKSNQIKSNQITLEDLVLHLQHARNIIPSPYNKEQLQLHQDVDHVQALQHLINFPEQYKVENLMDFVNPKNHSKALLEMKIYPDIIDWICMAALHPKLNDEERSKCVMLLKHMESPTELEEAILGVGEISYNSAQTVANEVVELKTEVSELKTEVSSLKTTVCELSSQLKNANDKLDFLIALISNQNEHGEKRKFEMDVDSPKSIFFSKPNM